MDNSMPKRTVAIQMEVLYIVGRLDRFSQDAIIAEFEEKMKSESGFSCDLCDVARIHNDGEEDFFITGVIGDRWYIIWEFDKEKNRVIALALSLGREQPKNRKEIELLTHDSHLGHFKPMWWKWRRCAECLKENTA